MPSWGILNKSKEHSSLVFVETLKVYPSKSSLFIYAIVAYSSQMNSWSRVHIGSSNKDVEALINRRGEMILFSLMWENVLFFLIHQPINHMETIMIFSFLVLYLAEVYLSIDIKRHLYAVFAIFPPTMLLWLQTDGTVLRPWIQNLNMNMINVIRK